MSTPTIETPYRNALLAGALAGTIVDLSLYPLDTLKTRLQASSGFLAAGGFRGVYSGVGSALLGSAPSAALFFLSYEAAKSGFRSARPENRGKEDPSATLWREPLEHMAAASAGEVAACAVRVPTEVVKQRAQARVAGSSWGALKGILVQRGEIGLGGVWRELYRGWSITVLREVPFTVIQFPLWEALKEWRRRTTGREGITGWESGLAGCVSGAVAAGVTTPLDVLKTRLMLAKERVDARVLLRSILRDSGPGAFFRGVGPRVLWIGAGGWIFLGTYQWGLNVLGGEYID